MVAIEVFLPVLIGVLARTDPVVEFRWWLTSRSWWRVTRGRRSYPTVGLGLVLIAPMLVNLLPASAQSPASAIGGSVLLGGIGAPLWLYLLISLWMAGAAASQTMANVVLLLLGVYLLARAVLRWVLIPAGQSGAAYWTAYYAMDYLTLQHRANAVIEGLRAWRNSGRSPQDLDFLHRRLLREQRITPVSLVAAGLLQAARGQTDNARLWFQSVATVRPRFVEMGSLKVAVLWLCGEAAARGAWKEVLAASQRISWKNAWSASARLYRHVASGLLERGGPRPWDLDLLTWFVPTSLRPLVHLLGTPVRWRDERTQAEPVPSMEEAGWVHAALARHVDMLGGARSVEALVELGLAWDNAEVGVLPFLVEAGEAERTDLIADWRSTVVTELSRLLRESGVSLSQLGRCSGFLAQARRRVREEVLRELEERHEAIYRRKEDKRKLAAVEEWEEWNQARRAYALAKQQLGKDIMPMVWHLWHARFCNYGVWLFNDRKEKMIAHHIFAWLLDEAREMDDDKAIKLETKNTAVTSR